MFGRPHGRVAYMAHECVKSLNSLGIWLPGRALLFHVEEPNED